jgi:MerR family transcriptional regulator, mercuric resistance operon regulatory protein
MPEGMTIGRLAKAAGVNVETVRYYQRRGLIGEPERPLGGQRRYPPSVVRELGFIRHAQQLGFSLEEVKSLLALSDGRRCRDARLIAERKYAVLETRMAQLEAMMGELKGLIDACRQNKSRNGCPMIDALFRSDGDV